FAADSAEPSPADVRRLVVPAELGDAADDNGVHAQQLAQFGGARRVGPAAVGEVLLGHHLVERLAFHDRINTAADQIINHQVRNALTDVHVGAEDRRRTALYRA